MAITAATAMITPRAESPDRILLRRKAPNAVRQVAGRSVGRPDDRWGEAVVAAVVLRPGLRMSEADILALLSGRIARYKHPREVRFVEALPRTALGKVNSADQQQALSEEIQERVISIFEACNFQDLTGQRISKVMNTMKFIEHHIVAMMEIWGGVDEIKSHAPPVVDTRDEDAKLLNGPRALGESGHASQDDIDALFN